MYCAHSSPRTKLLHFGIFLQPIRAQVPMLQTQLTLIREVVPCFHVWSSIRHCHISHEGCVMALVDGGFASDVRQSVLPICFFINDVLSFFFIYISFVVAAASLFSKRLLDGCFRWLLHRPCHLPSKTTSDCPKWFEIDDFELLVRCCTNVLLSQDTSSHTVEALHEPTVSRKQHIKDILRTVSELQWSIHQTRDVQIRLLLKGHAKHQNVWARLEVGANEWVLCYLDWLVRISVHALMCGN